MAACKYNASELGSQQRKNGRSCDPGEKEDTANTASYSSATLNHRFFSCIATKMNNCGFYCILPVLLAPLVWWSWKRAELLRRSKKARCSKSVIKFCTKFSRLHTCLPWKSNQKLHRKFPAWNLSFMLTEMRKCGRHPPCEFHGKALTGRLLKLLLCTNTELLEGETGAFHTSLSEPWA